MRLTPNFQTVYMRVNKQATHIFIKYTPVSQLSLVLLR